MQRTKGNEEIYKSLAKGMQSASTRLAGGYRALANAPVLQLEFSPYINRIISPSLRPVCVISLSKSCSSKIAISR
jgi:chromosome transmission fidelity protein 18